MCVCVLCVCVCVCVCVCACVCANESLPKCATAALSTPTSTESVQKSLEAKFFEGRQGPIPVTPTPEFQDRMGVSVQLTYSL